jgi:hypothetical protein
MSWISALDTHGLNGLFQHQESMDQRVPRTPSPPSGPTMNYGTERYTHPACTVIPAQDRTDLSPGTKEALNAQRNKPLVWKPDSGVYQNWSRLVHVYI